jgi:four helix bundle protein
VLHTFTLEWRPRFNFEKLETWQKAIDFADLVYLVTRNFPDEEKFGLTSQMRRARRIHFLEHRRGQFAHVASRLRPLPGTASGSLFEVVSQSVIGLRQGFLSKASYDQLYAAAEEQSRMLSGLRRSLVNN